LTLFVS